MLMRYQPALRSDRAALPTNLIIMFHPKPRNRARLFSGGTPLPLALDGLCQTLVDLILQRVRGAEDEDAARADRHFLAGFGIAADAPSLLPDRKAPERGNLDHFSALERAGNLGDHRFDELGRLVAR